ncbi:MAG: hypothetical protein ACQESR_03450, partial [Planctomycetota bacterium]
FLGVLEVLSSQYRRNERRNNMDGNDLEFFLTPVFGAARWRGGAVVREVYWVLGRLGRIGTSTLG